MQVNFPLSFTLTLKFTRSPPTSHVNSGQVDRPKKRAKQPSAASTIAAQVQGQKERQRATESDTKGREDQSDPIETLSRKDIERIGKPIKGSIQSFFKKESAAEREMTLLRSMKREAIDKEASLLLSPSASVSLPLPLPLTRSRSAQDYMEAKLLTAKIEELTLKQQQQQQQQQQCTAAVGP